MPEGHGFRARAHHLVGVAAASMPLAVAPSAMADTAGLLPRASRRSSAGVDAPAAKAANRFDRARERPGQSPARPVNPRLSGYAWYQNFDNGNQNNNNKGWRCRVRAVRK
ncbi:MAG: hypothetical protein IH626_22915 [Rhodospirillales bacterium]|nr:hypothetical protein [Rhodospirillales bacterium]